MKELRTRSTFDFGKPEKIRFVDPVVCDPERETCVPILQLAYKGGMAFVDSYVEGRGDAGELLVNTRANPPLGTELVAEVRWPGLPNRVYLRAFARGRRGEALVLRLHPDESLKRDFLINVACGTALRPSTRRHRRYCVRIPLEWRRFGTRVMASGIAEDLSAGGMLITAADTTVVTGDTLVLRIRGKADLVLTGTVQHLERRPASGEVGLGVQFDNRGSEQQRTLRRILRSYSSRGVMIVDLQ